MEENTTAQFLDILQNRDHRFGTDNGHIVLIGPERNLASLEEACFSEPQDWTNVITARYTFMTEHPSIVFGTLLYRLAKSILSWPNTIDDSQYILRQRKVSSKVGWQRLSPIAQHVLDNISDSNDGSTSLNWVYDSFKLRWSNEAPQLKMSEQSHFADETLLPSGQRVVVFLRLEGTLLHINEWITWLGKLSKFLPYRSVLVISGLDELPSDPNSIYQHQLEQPPETNRWHTPEDRGQFETAVPAVSFNKNSALNDTPGGNDALDRGIYADAIARLLAHKDTTPPLTVGIHGPWGMGKSSFMRQIAERLRKCQEPEFLIVDFNAWRYNDDHQVWAGLLNKVSHAIEGKIGWFWRLCWRIQEFWLDARLKLILGLSLFVITSVAAILARDSLSPVFTILGVGVPALSTLLVGVFRKTQRLSSRIADAARLPRHNIELGFQNIVMDELKSMQRIVKRRRANCRTVVFIDDLDRCCEDRIIETLQAIILVLAESEVIVVLGIDTHMIHRAVKQRYKDIANAEIGSDKFTHRYLRKIIQLPFHLPQIAPSKQTSFINGLFSQDSVHDLATTERELRDGQIAEDPADPDHLPLVNTPSIVLDIKRAPSHRFENVSVRDTSIELQAFHDYQDSLENNPREIKRAINIHRLMKLLLQARGMPEAGWSNDQQRRLVRWVLFCTGWPKLVQLVLDHKTMSSHLNDDVIDYCIDHSTDAAQDTNHRTRLRALKRESHDPLIRPIDLNDELRFVAAASVLLGDDVAPA